MIAEVAIAWGTLAAGVFALLFAHGEREHEHTTQRQ